MRKKGILLLIFNVKNEVLLIQQNKKQKAWTFVSGAIEGGESEIVASIRELKEETGISIKRDDLFYTNKIYQYRDVSGDEVLQFVFFAKTKDDFVKKVFDEEVFDLKWVNLDEVQGYLAYDGLKTLFTEITPIIVSYLSNDK